MLGAVIENVCTLRIEATRTSSTRTYAYGVLHATSTYLYRIYDEIHCLHLHLVPNLQSSLVVGKQHKISTNAYFAMLILE
jgi:hypothetical protein